MNSHDIQYDVFLEGKSVDLVLLTEEIVNKSNWYRWFNDPETTKYMQKGYFPNSKEDQLKFLKKEIDGNKTKLQVGILHKTDRVLIGLISLEKIDFLNRKCEIAGLIGENNYKRIKYWLEANRLIISHAVNALNIRKIHGGSLAREISLLYERMLGFISEGRLHGHLFKSGEYRDVYLFGKIFESTNFQSDLGDLE
jgi:RimJ/RimL family protein N-acetyltransferase